MSSVRDNFLALEPRYSDYRKSRYAVLPVPYDATTTFRTGTRDGPRAVISASQQVEPFDHETNNEPYTVGIATLAPLEPQAAGPQQMHEHVLQAARRIARAGKFLIALGGEHGITSALVRAVMTRYKKLSVLQIDAHADLRNSYQGSAYSHACVMRRVLELGATVVPVGVRSFSAEEARFMRRAGVRPVPASKCTQPASHCSGPSWIDEVVARLQHPVYVTIDMDGFDPSCVPGVGTPEPGGLDWYTACRLLRAVTSNRRVVAADVVETLPLPGSVVSEFLAARLVYKLIAYVEASPCRESSSKGSRTAARQ